MVGRVICFRGDKGLWLEFAIACKRKKVTVWSVLEPAIREYTKKRQVANE